MNEGGAPSEPILIPTRLAGVAEEAQNNSNNKGNHKSPYPLVAHFIWAGEAVVVGNARGEIEMIKTQDILLSPSPSPSPSSSATSSSVRGKIKGASSIIGFSEDSQRNLLAVNCRASRSGFLHILRRKDRQRAPNKMDVDMTPATATATETGTGTATETEIESNYEHVFDFHQPTHDDSPMGWCCFNWDGSYLVGSGDKKNKHQIYLWSVQEKTLDTVLEGPDISIWHMAWRPYRANLLSLADGGKILIWAKDYVENWSSFAPGFRELQHNEEYVEAEDEFDRAENNAPSRSCQISSNEEYNQDVINIMC